MKDKEKQICETVGDVLNKIGYYKKRFKHTEEINALIRLINKLSNENIELKKKLPEDSVANQKLFDEFVKFAKDKFNLTIVKDDTKKPITFEELFGKVFENSVVLSREEWKQIKNSLYYSKEELKKKLQKTSKETAEKFKSFIFSEKTLKSQDFIEQGVIILFEDDVKDFIKQFGVEIKE